ncbi:(2Fe-2S)-binding protein [Infirmifilum lucidum]|uniref:(2Fe-2S)-binding protein n=1 Tax=Infirmifilum lucidum TaxID=2776706 RepID=A0A7L9FI87_9CREN|nr:(2Fe-2S)-binding protein [Infirmifilum lucidum]QOJ79417.1 (2Fe-2S)-binding protein [Infirmifilum lucidum]
MGGEEHTGEVKAYICMCEKVAVEDVDRALEEGITDLESLKRKLRVGMGPCQGRFCIPILISYVGRRLGVPPEKLAYPTVRPPLEPVPARVFLQVRGREI